MVNTSTAAFCSDAAVTTRCTYCAAIGLTTPSSRATGPSAAPSAAATACRDGSAAANASSTTPSAASRIIGTRWHCTAFRCQMFRTELSGLGVGAELVPQQFGHAEVRGAVAVAADAYGGGDGIDQAGSDGVRRHQ